MERILLLPLILLFLIPVALIAQPQTEPQPQQMTAAPTEPTAFQHAMKLYRQGRFAMAIDELNVVVTSEPDNAAAYYFMGYANYVTRHYPEAMAAFGKAFELDPSLDPRPYFRGH